MSRNPVSGTGVVLQTDLAEVRVRLDNYDDQRRSTHAPDCEASRPAPSSTPVSTRRAELQVKGGSPGPVFPTDPEPNGEAPSGPRSVASCGLFVDGFPWPAFR